MNVYSRSILQHPALCEFPSREFYDRKLTTDDNVKSRTEKEAHLQRFWPQGKERPFVFCNVVGREAETHTGQKGTARVGLESKYNKEEAMKIVRTSLNCVVCLYTQQNNHGSQNS